MRPRKPLDVIKDDLGPPYENCCICDQPSAYWYEPRDVPLCQKCALVTSARDVPSKARWLKEGALINQKKAKPVD